MINVGMVGVGCISGIYLQNLHNVFNGHLRLVAVCDLIRERAENAQREYGVPKLYDTMEELLKFPGVGRKGLRTAQVRHQGCGCQDL